MRKFILKKLGIITERHFVNLISDLDYLPFNDIVMSIIDLFSKRQKRLKGEIPDVYTYDELPKNVRIQIVHIMRDCIGEQHYSGQGDEPEKIYKLIFEALCREYGVFQLVAQSYEVDYKYQVTSFLLEAKETDKAFDVIELAFRCIERIIAKNYQNYTYNTQVKLRPEEGIVELNERLKESGIGYSFEHGRLIRIDSTFVHSEITKPAIALLWNAKFQGANEEYLKAHEHYRHGRNKECLAECLKAFESTMKIICKEKGWPIDPNHTAKKLIQICFDNGLVPLFMQSQFTSLKSALESGIPTLRNKLGGHGQGQTPQSASDEITRYALNLTASNIIFLVEQSGIK